MRLPIPIKRVQRLLRSSEISLNFGLAVHFSGRIDPSEIEVAFAKTRQIITPFSLSTNETARLVRRCRDPGHPERTAEVPVVWGLTICNGVLAATFTSCEADSVVLGYTPQA